MLQLFTFLTKAEGEKNAILENLIQSFFFHFDKSVA